MGAFCNSSSMMDQVKLDLEERLSSSGVVLFASLHHSRSPVLTGWIITWITNWILTPRGLRRVTADVKDPFGGSNNMCRTTKASLSAPARLLLLAAEKSKMAMDSF